LIAARREGELTGASEGAQLKPATGRKLDPETRVSAEGEAAPAHARGADRTAVGLLRALLGELDDPPPESGNQVILQGEVDGVRYTLTRHRPQPPESELPSLSSREREIARMIAKGYTNKTIAVVLEISTWTVDTHIRRIFAKLRVRSRSAMVAQLAAAGLVAAADDHTPEWQAAWVRHSTEG
jgi:DNA-binding CsgD family transcriptional regulator